MKAPIHLFPLIYAQGAICNNSRNLDMFFY